MVCNDMRSVTRHAHSLASAKAALGTAWRFTLVMLLALSGRSALATALATVGPLPGDVEACIAAGNCSIAADSSFELGGIAAFHYVSPQGAGYLLRYPVLPPSLARGSQTIVDFDQDPPLVRQVESQTALSGSLWLGVQASYALSTDVHELQLYVDQVQPAAQRLLPRLTVNGPPPTVLHFAFSSEALLAGQAHRRMALDPMMGTVDEGSLQSAEPLLPCVADGCSVAQFLALIGIGYSAQGEDLVLHFDDQDSRRALYGEETAYNHPDNGFSWRRDYFVQAVPLPGAGMLTLLGVALLLPRTRRSR